MYTNLSLHIQELENQKRILENQMKEALAFLKLYETNQITNKKIKFKSKL